MPVFKPRTIVASAARPVLSSGIGDPGALGRSGSAVIKQGVADGRQAQAWELYDRVGPVSYAHRYSSNVMRRVDFFAAVVDDEDGDPIPGSVAVKRQPDGRGPLVSEQEWADAQFCVDRVSHLREGQGGIAYGLCLNLLVAGDCYVTCETLLDGREDWQVRSVVAITRKAPAVSTTPGFTGNGWWVPDESGSGMRELPVGSFVDRIHIPHPSDPRRADCAMLHTLEDCEEYDYLSRAVVTAARSKAAGNGVFLVPNELDIPPDPNDQDEVRAKKGSMTTLLRIIARAMAAGIKDPRSPAATAPSIMSGPGEVLQYARHLTFERPLDPAIVKERGDKLKVIAVSLDLPQERLSVEGMANNNHWSAAQVTENEWNGHLDPLARIICANWTAVLFRTQMLDLGYTEEQVDRWVVWYDPTDAIEKPDKSANAKDAHDRMVISDAALRQYDGFDEDDAPTPEEIADRVERERLRHTRSENGPEQVPPGDVSPNAPNEDPPPAPAPTAPTPAPAQNTVRASAAAIDRLIWLAKHEPATLRQMEDAGRRATMLTAAGTRRKQLGEQLSDLDDRLLHRVRTAAHAAMRRELDRAGSRLQQAATRRGLVAAGRRSGEAALRDVPRRRIAAELGQQVVTALTADGSLDLFDDTAFDEFCDEVDVWVDDTRQRSKDLIVAAAIAAALARGRQDPIGSARLAEWTRLQQQDSEAGRAALKASMLELAAQRLYDPDPRVDDRGEYDADLTVPAGLVRSALAVYGGNSEGDARAPFGALLVASGATMLALARSGGFNLLSYEWAHGSPLHPFEPHEQLDGMTFDNFDDPALSVGDTYGWIGSLTGGYFPGDHTGCTCICRVILGYGDDA